MDEDFYYNNSLNSSLQVTWREALTHFQLGFYRKAMDAELKIL